MSYTVVSLFSGAGFLDFGFTENGFRVIWGAELVREFAASNNYNIGLAYGHENIIQNVDITEVDPADIPSAIGLIGGPPCQDFSIGNANSPGVQGDRGKLVWDYLRKLKGIEPDFFLFENVEALYKTKKHREEALFPLLEKFRELGYEADFRVLNALDYGIPQDRSRVFIVGFKNSICEELRKHDCEPFKWPEKKYENAKKMFTWPTTWDFGYSIDESEYIHKLEVPYELTVHSLIGSEEELMALPNHVAFRPYSDRFNTVAEGDVRRKSFKRLHRFRYSPTVAYGNNEVHLHPTLPRRLSVREGLRLQSVPDWYRFPEGTPLDKMFKMVSNGVPYKLAELLAVEIRTTLDTYNSLHLKAPRIAVK